MSGGWKNWCPGAPGRRRERRRGGGRARASSRRILARPPGRLRRPRGVDSPRVADEHAHDAPHRRDHSRRGRRGGHRPRAGRDSGRAWPRSSWWTTARATAPPRWRARRARAWCASRAAATGRPAWPASPPPAERTCSSSSTATTATTRASSRDVLAPILAGEADLVIGSRELGRRGAGAQPLHAVLGHAPLRGAHEPCSSAPGPPTSVRSAPSPRTALRRLDMRDRNFGWTVEMQVKAARAGLRVREVPVDYRPRIGRSKVSGTLLGQRPRGGQDPGDDRPPRARHGRPGGT